MKMFGLPTDESMRPLADGNWQELVRSMDVCTGAQALIFEQMQQAGIGPEAFVLRHPHPGGVDPLVLEQVVLWYAERRAKGLLHKPTATQVGCRR